MKQVRARLPWKYREAQRVRTEAARHLFHEFNGLYFGGRLPRDIKVRFSKSKYLFMRGTNGTVLGGKYREWTPMYLEVTRDRWLRNDGETIPIQTRREIVLSGGLDSVKDADLKGTLIHEMIHAAGFDHGEAFATETRRLKALGALVQDKDLESKPGKGGR